MTAYSVVTGQEDDSVQCRDRTMTAYSVMTGQEDESVQCRDRTGG